MTAEIQDRYVRPRRSIFLVAATTFALALTTLGIAPAGANQQGASASLTSDESEITRLLISYEPGVTPVDASGEVTGQNYVPSVDLEEFNRIGKNVYTVDLPDAVSESEAIKIATEFEKSPQVKIVEPDYPISLSVTEAENTQNVNTSGLWGLDRIDQRSSTLNGAYKYDETGLSVDAYVIDSGINPHNEFQDRLELGYDAVTGEVDTLEQRHSVDCSNSGHGTHVAGILGGTTFGVAKQVSLIPVRVFDCYGYAYTADLISAIDWVMLHHQPGQLAVANMSLGGNQSDILDLWVQALINDGVNVVVASGNDNVDACNSSPASTPGTITVNSSGITDARSSFSNFGACTDIFAPGEEILSASISSEESTAIMSGTSMATPFVAGAVAKILEANPSFDRNQVVSKLLKNATPFVSGKANDPSKLLFSPDIPTEQQEVAEAARVAAQSAAAAAAEATRVAAAKKRLADQKAAAARLAASPPVVKKSLKVKALKKKRVSIAVAAPKGSKTVIQRKVGKKWKTVVSKTTTPKMTVKVSKSGKYRVRIKLPTGTVTSKTFRVK
jgi:subtilisin family serine protease